MLREEPGARRRLRKSIRPAKRKAHRPMAFSALESGDLMMLRMLREEKPDLAHVRDLDGMTLLRKALFRGDEEAVGLLLETAGPLDAFEAAVMGRADRLAELLDNGMARAGDESPEGYGLLHLACFYGRAEVADLLLGRGADLRATCSHPMGVRPLHCAAAGGHRSLALSLLERGADAGDAQAGGWRPLHHAARHGDRVLAEALLAKGADPAARSDRGQSAADVARGTGHGELAALLDERTAGR